MPGAASVHCSRNVPRATGPSGPVSTGGVSTGRPQSAKRAGSPAGTADAGRVRRGAASAARCQPVCSASGTASRLASLKWPALPMPSAAWMPYRLRDRRGDEADLVGLGGDRAGARLRKLGIQEQLGVVARQPIPFQRCGRLRRRAAGDAVEPDRRRAAARRVARRPVLRRRQAGSGPPARPLPGNGRRRPAAATTRPDGTVSGPRRRCAAPRPYRLPAGRA